MENFYKTGCKNFLPHPKPGAFVYPKPGKKYIKKACHDFLKRDQ
jgi:hypothetical protein